MKKIFSIILVSVMLNGCAAGYMTRISYDNKTNARIREDFTPLFASDSEILLTS